MDAWVDDWSDRLKHKQGTAGRFIKELQSRRADLDKRNFIERDEKLRRNGNIYAPDSSIHCVWFREGSHSRSIANGVQWQFLDLFNRAGL